MREKDADNILNPIQQGSKNNGRKTHTYTMPFVPGSKT